MDEPQGWFVTSVFVVSVFIGFELCSIYECLEMTYHEGHGLHDNGYKLYGDAVSLNVMPNRCRVRIPTTNSRLRRL